MIISIAPVTGSRYAVKNGSLPIRISIESENEILVAGEPLVNSAFIAKEDDRESTFGLSQLATRLPGKPFFISKHAPYRVVIDILKDEEDQEALTPGSYRMHVAFSLYLQDKTGRHSLAHLKEEFPLQVEVN